ncbi:MAG: biotin--[acetyl-CoA-carboxylase] ligase [Planctomycetota bacterium]|jgi:BirA family biotin operon repressor/biotin-[acetyl-CoA-carboxylase] ligase|nr:biotin--[acetyl-CoA-carboxylase] ligase [Planctomycetota bacterium]
MKQVSYIRQEIATRLLSGDWTSGESLARGLGISRAAVAKHVAVLRSEGWGIKSATRRGYHLEREPDRIDIGVIRRGLTTRLVGKGDWVWLDKTASTNQVGVDRAQAGSPAGTVILAERQTRGRGSKGRPWQTLPGSVSLSVVLSSPLPAREIPWLTAAGTLAVRDMALALAKLPVVVRQPNDVYAGGRKLAGVLAECGVSAGEMDWAVVGIGVNVNVELEALPASLAENATSLLAECGHPFRRDQVCIHLLNRLDHYLSQLPGDPKRVLRAAWKVALPPEV